MTTDPYRFSYPQPRSIPDFLQFAHHTLVAQPLREKAKTPEQKFRELDVQVGDRVRLTQKLHESRTGSPSTLEGVVIGTKVKDGKTELRIDGFGHTGGSGGGQHVWFVGADYRVEVLHKAYRWTKEDRAIVAVMGTSERDWEQCSEAAREAQRRQWRPRLLKVRKALGDI